MQNSTPWSTGKIVGAVFALIILPGSASLGFGLFLLNLIAIACFVAPMVFAHREQRATEERESQLPA